MRDITFGQFYPVKSFLHNMDARAKLVLSIAYIVMIFFVKTYVGYALTAVFIFAVIFLSRVPVMRVLKSIRPMIFLILFTVVFSLFFYNGRAEDAIFSWGIFHMYWAGLHNAIKMALRLILLVLGPAVLTLTTTPVQITDAIESLLKPLSYIKFPVHELAIIMSIALRLIPTLVDETDKIISAQKARGADFESGNIFKRAKAMIPILIPLFVSSFRRADELAYAMDSRCYRGAKGRTRMKTMRFSWRDLVATFVFVAIFFCILVLSYNYFGWAWITIIAL